MLRAIAAELHRLGVDAERDRFGQIHARIAGAQGATRAVAFVAHTDHPGFEVVSARSGVGRARMLGGVRPISVLSRAPIPVLVHHDDERGPVTAVLDDFREERDSVAGSPGTMRIRADGAIEPGMWAVLDVPAFARDGERLHLRAADDLAGCAMALLAAASLARETRPFDVHLLFTRAEETGLYGARLAAELGTLPRDAYVISIEASRELPSAVPGSGIVVRAGDLHNTFSNEAERALRVGQERLAAKAIATQRALLTGGTCEASAFVRLGHLATGIALPNVNYHNVSPDERLIPEVVHMADVRSGVALLAEAAVAAAEDAVESWWPASKTVPDAIRSALARGVSRTGN